MSLEDQARIELERRQQKLREEERLKEEARSQQEKILAERTENNLKLLTSLNLQPQFEEVRNKYWGIGELSIFSDSNQAVLKLNYEYSVYRYQYSAEDSSEWVDKAFLLMELVLSQRQNNEISITFNASPSPYYKKSIKPVTQTFRSVGGSFVHKEAVVAWIQAQIVDYIIHITDGNLDAREVFSTFLNDRKKRIEEYEQQQRDAEARNKEWLEKRQKKSERQGCWLFK